MMQTRAERERDTYNKDGLEREAYSKVLSHCGAYSDDFLDRRYNAMLFAHGKVVLELGSTSWRKWLEKSNIYPSILHAINISERELEKGKELAKDTVIKPLFHIMDAHKLEFEDNTFDMIFGSGILHHLDLNVVLGEVKRVLKPQGRIVFFEPLDINPFAKVARYLTPRARTLDEQAFRFKELSVLRDHFEIDLYPHQLFTVPFGVLSNIIFSKQKNLLTYSGYQLDKLLYRFAPSSKYFFRFALIIGRKR